MIAPELRRPRCPHPSGQHRLAEDGGTEAQALLLPLARLAYQIGEDGAPRIGAWPAVARMLGLPSGAAAALGYLWRGDRRITAVWRARLVASEKNPQESSRG
jgi:hypothetical protein